MRDRHLALLVPRAMPNAAKAMTRGEKWTYVNHHLVHIYAVHPLNTLGVDVHDEFFRREKYFVGPVNPYQCDL